MSTLGFTSAVRERPPVLYSLAKALERRRIRGSTRLLGILLRTGVLNRPVRFPLGNGLSITVPIARSSYDQWDLDSYETDFIAGVSTAIEKLGAPVTLIDGGADIGVFSLKLLGKCSSIREIVAFEPNPETIPWLELNLLGQTLGRRTVSARVIPEALSDSSGKGKLTAPETQFLYRGLAPSHTDLFVASSSDGPVPLTTIDALDLPAGALAIKLDLEGGELAALRGAARTITNATKIVVAVEAHPQVARRTGIDPIQCLNLLRSLRPFHFIVSETGQSVDVERPFFDQVSPGVVYNLIGSSHQVAFASAAAPGLG